MSDGLRFVLLLCLGLGALAFLSFAIRLWTMPQKKYRDLISKNPHRIALKNNTWIQP